MEAVSDSEKTRRGQQCLGIIDILLPEDMPEYEYSDYQECDESPRDVRHMINERLPPFALLPAWLVERHVSSLWWMPLAASPTRLPGTSPQRSTDRRWRWNRTVARSPRSAGTPLQWSRGSRAECFQVLCGCARARRSLWRCRRRRDGVASPARSWSRSSSPRPGTG